MPHTLYGNRELGKICCFDGTHIDFVSQGWEPLGAVCLPVLGLYGALLHGFAFAIVPE